MNTDDQKRLMEIISEMSDKEVQDLLCDLENEDRETDKRHYPRFPYVASVEYMGSQTRGKVTLRDISISGVFLNVEPSCHFFSVGQELLLRVPYPDKDRFVRIRGRIVRVVSNGVGVAFE